MTKTKKRGSLYIFYILILILIYAYADVSTSKMAGFKSSVRTDVYIYLSLSIILMTLYNVFNRKGKIISNGILKSLWLLLFWVLFVGIANSSDSWSLIIQFTLAFWWIVAYAFFYNYERLNYFKNGEGYVIIFFIIMLFFYIYATVFTSINIKVLYDSDFAVVNFVYYVIVIMPFVFFIENNKIRTALLLAITIIVVYSFKRGALLIYPMMMLARTFSEAKLSNKTIDYFFKYVGIIFFFVIALFYINHLSDNFLFDRFSEEELQSGSGRTDIYKLVIDNLYNRDWLTLIIGSGAGSSVKLIGTGAHNEWLEFLYSYGIIGVVFYLGFILSLVKRYIQLMKLKNKYAPYYSMIVVYVLMVGVFGGFYFVHSTFYVFALLGFLEAKIAVEQEVIPSIKKIYK